ncbi:carph-isopro domain-containing protein [Bauldia litoralis]|uniref:carph-isopro domain-containing protein n=1 Tax=Bauldia litoralis TaxID=665467 RepID=UPI0032630EFC
MESLDTQAHRIIAKFGTASRLARLLGHRNSSTVSGWKSTGLIPQRWHRDILRLAQQEGIEMSSNDFLVVIEHPDEKQETKLDLLRTIQRATRKLIKIEAEA